MRIKRSIVYRAFALVLGVIERVDLGDLARTMIKREFPKAEHESYVGHKDAE